MPSRSSAKPPAAQGEPISTGSDFAAFPRLPPEIRHEIWKFADGAPKSLSTVCILHTEPNPEKKRYLQHKPLLVHEPHDLALLATNSEAREITLGSSPRAREYNSDKDILYVSGEAFDSFTRHLLGRNDILWAHTIKHLAIPVSHSDKGLYLPYALEFLESLETIAIVYPETTGKVDCFAKVETPSTRNGIGLRALTSEEEEKLTIRADYTYGTWAGDFDIKWEMGVRQHLKQVEETLNRECTPGNAQRGHVSPLWDYDAKRLNLKYIPMCFQDLGSAKAEI